MITLTNADAALKDYYLDAVSQQLNDGISPFFNAIEKTTQYVYGKNAKIALVKGNLNRIITGAEDGDIPDSAGNKYYDVTLPLKNIYGSIAVTDKALRASQDSSGAFVNLLNAEMEGLVSDAKANFARMLFGDGNGNLAAIVEVTGTKVRLTNIKSWYAGLVVDIANEEGTAAEVEGLTVASVDSANSTITFDKTVPNLEDYVGRYISVSGAYGKEICGLAGVFDYQNIYGFDKTKEKFFDPYVKRYNSVSADDIISAIEEIEERGGKVRMILCSHSVRNTIASLFKDSKIIASDEIKGGYTSVFVNEVPVYADRFCPSDRIYLLNPEDFVLCQLCDWEWMEDEGGRILSKVPGKAAYTATLVKYAELICKRPFAQGMLQAYPV